MSKLDLFISTSTYWQIDWVNSVYIRDLLREAFAGQEWLTLGLNLQSQFEW